MHTEALGGGVAEFDEAIRTGVCPFLGELGEAALGEMRAVYEQLDAGNYDALEDLADRISAAAEQGAVKSEAVTETAAADSTVSEPIVTAKTGTVYPVPTPIRATDTLTAGTELADVVPNIPVQASILAEVSPIPALKVASQEVRHIELDAAPTAAVVESKVSSIQFVEADTAITNNVIWEEATIQKSVEALEDTVPTPSYAAVSEAVTPKLEDSPELAEYFEADEPVQTEGHFPTVAIALKTEDTVETYHLVIDDEVLIDDAVVENRITAQTQEQEQVQLEPLFSTETVVAYHQLSALTTDSIINETVVASEENEQLPGALIGEEIVEDTDLTVVLDFDTLMASQSVHEDPITLEVIRNVADETPLEQGLVLLVEYLAQPIDIEEQTEFRQVIQEIEVALTTYYIEPETGQLTRSLTLELTDSLIKLLRTCGYSNPGDVLVDMVSRSGKEFLFDALDHICEMAGDDRHELLSAMAIASQDDTEDTKKRLGKMLFGLIAQRSSHFSLSV